MIEVHRLNGGTLVINAELIETVEANPDTVIALTNGKRFVVAESISEVVRRVIQYRRQATGSAQVFDQPVGEGVGS